MSVTRCKFRTLPTTWIGDAYTCISTIGEAWMARRIAGWLDVSVVWR